MIDWNDERWQEQACVIDAEGNREQGEWLSAGIGAVVCASLVLLLAEAEGPEGQQAIAVLGGVGAVGLLGLSLRDWRAAGVLALIVMFGFGQGWTTATMHLLSLVMALAFTGVVGWKGAKWLW